MPTDVSESCLLCWRSLPLRLPTLQLPLLFYNFVILLVSWQIMFSLHGFFATILIDFTRSCVTFVLLEKTFLKYFRRRTSSHSKSVKQFHDFGSSSVNFIIFFLYIFWEQQRQCLSMAATVRKVPEGSRWGRQQMWVVIHNRFATFVLLARMEQTEEMEVFCNWMGCHGNRRWNTEITQTLEATPWFSKYTFEDFFAEKNKGNEQFLLFFNV